MKLDQAILQAAHAGLARQIEDLQEALAEVEKRLNGTHTGAHAAYAAGTKRRTMSAAGRARIAAAQRKRWAALKAAEAPKRRKLSPAARKKLAQNLAKARAAKAAKRKAA